MAAPGASIVGVDVGGTFTDCVAYDAQRGRMVIAKRPTTPQDQSEAAVAGIEETGVAFPTVNQVAHGTTTATNATIERQAAACVLVTTVGFRDVVELGRRDRPHNYGLRGTFAPLVLRRDRLEMGGRIGPEGEEVEPLTEAEVQRVVAELRARRPESIAISLIHAYANPEHEQRLEEAIRAELPDTYVMRSTRVYGELGEFERTSTTVISAYVGPMMTRYLERFDRRLREREFDRDYLVVRSNGGATSFRIAARHPAATIMSGPAAGVVAARAVADASGLDRAISFDMGGTSADIAVIVDGRVRQSVDNSLGFRLPLQVPMLEIDSIGAGGGSIASIDDAGILRVGPRSAGSEPGPACYGRGGKLPTVTDAHAALSHLPADSLARNHIATVDVAAAREAVRREVADPLGVDVDAAAEAVLEVVNENMAGRIRLLTVEKGLDVREFGLVAFGGAGPFHACGIMRRLDIGRAAIPPFPGLTSALGTVMGDVRHDFVQPFRRPLQAIDREVLSQTVKEHRERGRALLQEQGIPEASAHEVWLEMMYAGQRHPVGVEIAADEVATSDLAERFTQEYRRQYGATMEREVVLVTLRSAVVAELDGLDLEACASALREGGDAAPEQIIEARFGGRTHRTRILDRTSLEIGRPLAGPAILTQRDTTILLEPGFVARDTELGILEIRRED